LSDLVTALELLRGDEPTELLAKLSRRLVEVLGFEGYPCEIGYGFTHPDGRHFGWGEYPDCIGLPLASIDGAVGLMPKGEWWRIGKGQACSAEVGNNGFCDGATPAIALCIAILKARLAQSSGPESVE
jgi:hypothetical protein